MDLLAGLWATGDTAKVAEGVLAADSLIWKEHGDSTASPALQPYGDRFPQPDTGKGYARNRRGHTVTSES